MDKAEDDEEEEQEETPQKYKKPSKPRFSLFAPPTSFQASTSSSSRQSSNPSGRVEEEDGEEGEEEEGERDDNETIHGSVATRFEGKGKQQTSQEREDKLRESLYELRGMNEVFEGFLGALEGARGHNQVSQKFSLTSHCREYSSRMGFVHPLPGS